MRCLLRSKSSMQGMFDAGAVRFFEPCKHIGTQRERVHQCCIVHEDEHPCCRVQSFRFSQDQALQDWLKDIQFRNSCCLTLTTYCWQNYTFPRNIYTKRNIFNFQPCNPIRSSKMFLIFALSFNLITTHYEKVFIHFHAICANHCIERTRYLHQKD